MANKHHDPFRRIEELPSRLYVIFAILMLGLHIAVCNYTDVSPATAGLTVILIYAAICGVIFLFSRRQILRLGRETSASEAQNNGIVHALRNNVNIPYAVVGENGNIVTVNTAMRNAADNWGGLFDDNISTICSCTIQDILENVESERLAARDAQNEEMFEQDKHQHKPLVADIGGKKYRVECQPIEAKGKPFYLLVFHDVTELTELVELHHNSLTAVAYIALDNLEEIAQYVKVDYQAEARQADALLKAWASELGGMLREYDRNKYVLLISREKLAMCIKNKFDILDSLREILIGEDNLPLTASIGIATTGATMALREREALIALDMALQRGGDQAVLKNEQGIFYFGGRTKSLQKRTRGLSRVIAGKLCSMISGASNVIIMGHSNPDFDSIGACVGIAALAMHLGVDAKIVTDTECASFKACTSRLVELSDYKSMFVDAVTGLDVSSFGTLLIIVDANNFSILEAPEIANNSFKTALIDHHIKKEEFEHEPQLCYIDPSASSACELVSEILEQTLPEGTLRKEEANLLLSGIMVDTQNFIRTVGPRTFAAALYLRNAGAAPEYVRTFFEEAFEDYRTDAKFGAEARIYREHFAITALDSSDSTNNRVAAAKAADKLLRVRNISAAFALIRIGNTVHISARSDGSVNVQLILEKIGGGGHFDVAGAAVADSGLAEAEELLVGAIDQYFNAEN